MKIAISSTGEKLTDKVSEVFARCPYFIIAEVEEGKVKEFEAIKNESENQMSGAGISAAQLMAEKNVTAIITKNIGPRAFDVLRQFNIKVYSGRGKVKDVLEDFTTRKLEEVKEGKCLKI